MSMRKFVEVNIVQQDGTERKTCINTSNVDYFYEQDGKVIIVDTEGYAQTVTDDYERMQIKFSVF